MEQSSPLTDKGPDICILLFDSQGVFLHGSQILRGDWPGLLQLKSMGGTNSHQHLGTEWWFLSELLRIQLME